MKRILTRYYTIYENRTDSIIAQGFAENCAKQMGLTIGSFYSFISNVKTRKYHRYKGFSVVVEQLDRNEAEELAIYD